MAWQLPLGSVLVPYDFSEACKEAMRVARTMVAEDAQLHALYVTDLPAPGDPSAIWGKLDASSVVERASKSLQEAMDELGIGAQIAVVFGTGGPGDEIVDWATEKGVQLIVMPSHGRRGLRRVLLGSVTERVVRLAPMPVLTIRVPKPKKA